jgi:uncharacterized repeat protein (TIGR01451 family)
MKNPNYLKVFWIFSLFLLIINKSYAQFNQGSVISTCEVCMPVDMLTTDLNEDGYPDIVTASFWDNKIAYYQNNQNGGFLEQQIISSELGRASAVFVIDLNGDDRVDILAAGSENQIVWYENKGNNEFSDAHKISNKITGVADLFAIDLDGDSDKDVIAASSFEDKFVWFENDGTGSFSDEKILTTDVDKAWKIAANDLDGDLDIDIVVLSNSDSKVAWYENLGGGVFSEERLIDDSVPVVNSLAVGDYDSDGDLDIISGSNSKGKLTYYENDSIGNFAEGVTIAKDGIDISNIYVVDLNRDNHLDILTTASLDDELSWYKNDGTGAFEERVVIRDNLELVNAASVADIDLDGTCDIVYITELSNLGWLKNKGREQFDTLLDLTDNLNSFEQLLFLESADLNQDGFRDVLAAANNKVVWFKNNGDKSFSKAREISKQKGLASHILAIDIDNDGDKDVVHNDIEEEILYWSKNDGTGTFTERTIVEENIFTLTFSASDVDGDGDNDLLAANFNATNLSFFLNDGTGSFTKQERSLNEDLNVSAAVFEDVDNDGFQDLIVAGLDGSILIMRSDGDSTPVEQKIMIPIDYPKELEVVDIDGDEDKDILVVTNERILIFANDGDNFEYKDFIPIDESSRIFPVDIDGDNDLDIIIGTGGNVVWLINDGQGNFFSQQIISNYLKGDLVRDLLAFDMDNDGDQDIVAASAFFATITLYEKILDAPSIIGFAYWDENGNGEKDSVESTLGNFPIYLLPDSLVTFTNSEGYYQFFVPDGSYSIQSVVTECWENNSNNSTENFDVLRDTTIIKNIAFNKQSNYQHAQVRIQSARPRCGFDVSFVISVENDGCITNKGRVALVLDELVTFVQAQPMPTDINGDTLFWNYASLSSQKITTIPIIMTIAGPEFMGEILELEGISYIENIEGGLEVSSTFNYSSEIRCAYDPNDKLVFPNRTTDQSSNYDRNYTLFNELLEYTIRFQNTGNDTAFNVVIRDTLDDNLDWTTFKPILASHPFETLLYKDGQVEFSFKNILLPDSTTNEPLSHGFVTYKILPKKDLPENTIVENTAGIYFDFNPPIITNTTRNVLVSELPKITSISNVNLEQTVRVYPNPFGDFLTIERAVLQTNELLQLAIFDVTGKQMQSAILKADIQQISTVHLANGLYFYQLINAGGQMIGNGKMVKH